MMFGVKSVNLMHFTKNHIYFWAMIKQTEYIVIIHKEIYQHLKKVFVLGRGQTFIGHIESCIISFKFFIFYFRAYIEQTKFKFMTTKEENCKFHDCRDSGVAIRVI